MLKLVLSIPSPFSTMPNLILKLFWRNTILLPVNISTCISKIRSPFSKHHYKTSVTTNIYQFFLKISSFLSWFSNWKFPWLPNTFCLSQGPDKTHILILTYLAFRSLVTYKFILSPISSLPSNSSLQLKGMYISDDRSEQ